MTRLEYGPSVAPIQALAPTSSAQYSLLASPGGRRSKPLNRAARCLGQEQASRPGAVRSSNASSWRGLPRLCAGLAASLALGAAGEAQDSFHVSLTSARTVGSVRLDDSTLIRADAVGAVLPILDEGHWQALLGFVPGDVDAFSRRVGLDPEKADSMAFSFLSNTAGFKDGDVLGFDSMGGLQVLLSEAELSASLGVPGASMDVDAIDLGSTDLIYLSFQSDVLGTVLGDIKDGDVLVFDELSRGISVHTTEDDIQAAVNFATGSTAAIGDVLGICFQAGELLFSVQAPSAVDGAVFSLSMGGMLVRDELSMGLGGAELSALSLAQAGELPCFRFDLLSAFPGDTLQLQVHGAPNTLYVALYAGSTGFIDFARRPGWGAIAMSPADPWLLSTLSMGRLPFVITDAQGDYSGPLKLPNAALYGSGFANEEGWSFQMLEMPGLRLSAPVRVLKN